MLSKESIQFLADLKENNNRDWFLAQKKRYEAYKADYHQLIEKLLEAMKPLDESLAMLEVKHCTFRINRDIRFSKDKSPYKTHMGIWLKSGSLNNEAPGYYIQIDPEKSFVGGGLYCPEPHQLQKIRREINFFYDDLQEIVNNPKFTQTFGSLTRDENSTLKNPPRGFEKDHPGIELLKLKSFTAIEYFDTKTATQKDFVSQMSQKLILLKPLNDYLNRALSSEE